MDVDGEMASLFDTLEDMDVRARAAAAAASPLAAAATFRPARQIRTLLKKAQKLGGDPFEDTPKFNQNQAFIFIKPHAVTNEVKAFVKETLAAQSISILAGAHASPGGTRARGSERRRAMWQRAPSTPRPSRSTSWWTTTTTPSPRR